MGGSRKAGGEHSEDKVKSNDDGEENLIEGGGSVHLCYALQTAFGQWNQMLPANILRCGAVCDLS